MQGLAHREGGVRTGVRPGPRPPCPSTIPLQRSTSPHSGHPHISGAAAATSTGSPGHTRARGV
eukprot:209492-Prymnesium_polylepis.1